MIMTSDYASMKLKIAKKKPTSEVHGMIETQAALASRSTKVAITSFAIGIHQTIKFSMDPQIRPIRVALMGGSFMTAAFAAGIGSNVRESVKVLESEIRRR